MAAQMESVSKTFEQAFNNFRKATEATVQMQQDFFRQWSGFWPGFPKLQPTEKVQQFQKEWSQATAEVTKTYLQSWDRQCKAGMEALEKAFQLTEAKDAEGFHQNMIELWQKSFECLKNVAETQMQTFQTGVEKWIELAKKAKP